MTSDSIFHMMAVHHVKKTVDATLECLHLLVSLSTMFQIQIIQEVQVQAFPGPELLVQNSIADGSE